MTNYTRSYARSFAYETGLLQSTLKGIAFDLLVQGVITKDQMQKANDIVDKKLEKIKEFVSEYENKLYIAEQGTPIQ